jgi:hypothetical protein
MSDDSQKAFPRRTCKFNERVASKIIELCEEGKTDEQIAAIIGVTPRTLWYWKTKNPDLKEDMRAAKLDADSLVEATLLQKALGWNGLPPDTTSIIFWLKNRQPEKWRDRQPDEKGDTNIQVNNVQLNDEQLLKLVKAARGESDAT